MTADHESVEDLRRENARLVGELKRLRALADRHEKRIGEMERSTSWRVTYPVRQLREAMKADPWRMPVLRSMRALRARLWDLYDRDIRRVPLRVLAVSDAMIPSVEIILSEPLSALSRTAELQYRLALLRRVAPDDLFGIDVLFLLRSCDGEAVALVREAVARKVRVVYALDDDFETLDPQSALGEYYRAIDGWNNVQRISALADRVLVWTEGLRTKLLPYHPRPQLMPAPANLEKVDAVSGSLTGAMAHPGVTVFGYASGSHHLGNLRVAVPAIRRVLAEGAGKVRFECFFGAVPEELRGAEQVVALPEERRGLDAFYRALLRRRWDFGIAPLVDSEFNRSKSDNKYREYSACRIPAVYSDVPAYRSSVKHGVTGLLVPNDEASWYRALKELVGSEALRRQVARQARADVEERYSLDAVLHHYRNVFRELLHR